MELKDQNGNNDLETETNNLLQSEEEQMNAGLSPVEEKVARMRYGIPLEDDNSPLPFDSEQNARIRKMELKALQALLARKRNR